MRHRKAITAIYLTKKKKLLKKNENFVDVVEVMNPDESATSGLFAQECKYFLLFTTQTHRNNIALDAPSKGDHGNMFNKKENY